METEILQEQQLISERSSRKTETIWQFYHSAFKKKLKTHTFNLEFDF